MTELQLDLVSSSMKWGELLLFFFKSANAYYILEGLGGIFFLKRLSCARVVGAWTAGARAELESGEGTLRWTRDQGRLQGGGGPKDGQDVGVAGRRRVTGLADLPLPGVAAWMCRDLEAGAQRSWGSNNEVTQSSRLGPGL